MIIIVFLEALVLFIIAIYISHNFIICRSEEKCLVRSGLVHLLDKLCSLGTHRSDGISSECQNTRQKVAALAWAGFQVLANRCVTWETEDGENNFNF